VFAVKAIHVADVLEVLHPLIKAEQVEVRRRNEIDRILVGMKVSPDFRDVFQSLLGHGSILLISIFC
jgi:hypothetical protein